LEFNSKVLPTLLTDVGAWVGFCISSRVSNIKFCILKNKSGGVSLSISPEKYIKESKVIFNLEIK
jgi:hypothetical protein